MKKYSFPLIVFLCSVVFIIFAISLDQPIQQTIVDWGQTATTAHH